MSAFVIPWVPIGAIASVIGASASILGFLEEKDQTAYLKGIKEKLDEVHTDVKEIKQNVEAILEIVMSFDDKLNEQDRRNASRHLVSLVELGVEKLPGWIKEVETNGVASQTFQNFHMQLELAIKRADDFPEDSANVSLGIALNATIMRVLDQISLHPSTLRNHVSYLRRSSERLNHLADGYRPVGVELKSNFAQLRRFFGAEHDRDRTKIDRRSQFPYVRIELKSRENIDQCIEQDQMGYVQKSTPVDLEEVRSNAIGTYIPMTRENQIDVFPESWMPDRGFQDRAKTERLLRSQLLPLQQAYAEFRNKHEGLHSQAYGLSQLRTMIEAQLN
ncbi:MAG: hypothetical protein P8L68_10950 [Paracoccaceae bacterium]|nr:hypothetical protein [Paracoccaceae bacterium]MDG2259000.1 hypothetical protein [Paracoccaceae bacterium]